jgi:Flp pilus assembly protein TadD
LKYLGLIKKSEPDNAFANQLFDISKTIINLEKKQNQIESDPEIGIQLAENFILIGNKEKASLYLKSVLTYYPKNEKALQLIKKIN